MRNTQLGPGLICIGLAILFAAALWPSAPIVTAMAIIALGATGTIITRFTSSGAAVPIMVFHGTTYMLLYALFVGARLQVPTVAPTPGLSSMALLDLASSALPMTLALGRIMSWLRQSLLSRH